MANQIELVNDGDGLAVIGTSTDVERFFLSTGFDRVPSRQLDLHWLSSTLGIGGAAARVGADLAENSGRWVKLTAESAESIKNFGLMPTKTPGVSYAMIGQPGDVKQWLQITRAPSVLLGGPFALTALSTMMQQRAMQQQMDEIVDYLEEINEKVDDLLRGQKDAVLADMIGVDLMIEEAVTVRDQVGRVSEVTWSKVQSTGATIARTQAYALRQLDGIAEKLEKKVGVGEIAKATKKAEPKVREWLAVLARTFQLQEGISVLELDRVLDTSPEELDRHRLGLAAARRNRLEIIARSTARILAQMDKTIRNANTKVLFNPFDSPTAVRSSKQVTDDVLDFRKRLGIETGHEATDAKRWGHAVAEVRDEFIASTSDAVSAAGQFGADAFDRTTKPFRTLVTEDDGAPNKPQATALAEKSGRAIKGAATGATERIGMAFRRKKASTVSPESADPPTTSEES